MKKDEKSPPSKDELRDLFEKFQEEIKDLGPIAPKESAQYRIYGEKVPPAG